MNCVSSSGAGGHSDQVQQSVSCHTANVDKKTDADNDELNLQMHNDEVPRVNDDDEEQIPDWIRSSPADLYFKRDSVTIVDYDLM